MCHSFMYLTCLWLVLIYVCMQEILGLIGKIPNKKYLNINYGEENLQNGTHCAYIDELDENGIKYIWKNCFRIY